MKYIAHLSDLKLTDIALVGGKNASLGEMIGSLQTVGVHVPEGFAITTEAWKLTLETSAVGDSIYKLLDGLDVQDIVQLQKVGSQVREQLKAVGLPDEVRQEVLETLKTYSQDEKQPPFAVRSSATAEDLPNASFAGQQDTYLNVRGEEAIMVAIMDVYLSVFSDRAIAYRTHQGFAHREVLLSVGVQRMVNSSRSGVMFTIDPESAFTGVVLINAGYGLGEAVVGGMINPDEYYVSKRQLEEGHQAVIRRHLGSKAKQVVYAKAGQVETREVPVEACQQFCLSKDETMKLASLSLSIEKHYGCPVDIEWGIEGDKDAGELYILQVRPETVASKRVNESRVLERYRMVGQGECLITGRSVGQKIASGKVCRISNIKDMDRLKEGEVLVADMTDPDWEPVMSRAAAIVTDRGGRTCHAAIIARELGVPAVVGTIDGSKTLKDGQEVTVSCAEGDEGRIYSGLIEYQIDKNNVEKLPYPGCEIMMNIGNPDRVFDFQNLPNNGVGLARLEFIINRTIGVHPSAILDPSVLDSGEMRQLQRRMVGYENPRDFYVELLAEGIATLAVGFQDKPVIIRLSDFKSNEYARLLGGQYFEPKEENPMLGFRGASRYLAPQFQQCFEMECAALLRARNEMGLSNIEVMVPFVRTVEEAEGVVELLESNGLKRGENNLRLIMMCELPVNILLADEFLNYFDGFSIGSNDLTQLVLGLDRDSALVAHLFNEKNPAIKALLSQVIETCKARDKYIGICGQGPSDHPDFARWLVDQGISSISLNPDTVLDTWLHLSNEQ